VVGATSSKVFSTVFRTVTLTGTPIQSLYLGNAFVCFGDVIWDGVYFVANVATQRHGAVLLLLLLKVYRPLTGLLTLSPGMVCFSGGCYHRSVVMLFTALVFMVCQLMISIVSTNI